MSYKFKVGDKGLFRNGQYEYEIVAVGVQGVYADSTALVGIYRPVSSVAQNFTPFSRRENGQHSNANGLDLAPPKLKVWRITMRYAEPTAGSLLGWTQDYVDGEKANLSFTAVGRTKKAGDVITVQEVEIDHE